MVTASDSTLPRGGTFATQRIPWNAFCFPILVLGLRFAPAGIGLLAYLLLCVYALLGLRHAILSMYLVCLCNVTTHAFGAPPGMAAIFRHLIIFIAAFSVIVHAGSGARPCIPRLGAATAALCGLLLFHSAFLSEDPPVSILKGISFTLTILTLLTAWSRLDHSNRALLEQQIWGTLAGLAVLGFPLAFTVYGYAKTKIGFQGLLVHSQTFGPIMGVFATFLGMTWLTTRRASKWTVLTLAVTLASVYLSKARIGALVVVAGMTAGILEGCFIRLRNSPRLLKYRLTMAAAGICVALIVAGPRIFSEARKFIEKKDDVDPSDRVSITAEALESRGFLIESMMRNIQQNPLTGIGFGVATEGGKSGGVQFDPIFGLPIMAAVEKGVMPIAIVEELGIPLASLFGIWFLVLVAMAAGGGPINLGILAAALTTNVAESCFFSPGGMGMFFLVISTMAVTAGPAQARDRRTPRLPAAPQLARAA